jgi:biopolymer transport protein ExbD
MDESGFENINMIPLIDIMLVLLTIVLSTSTLIASGAIPLELPQASSHLEASRLPQNIELDSYGRIHYQGSVIGLDSLSHVLTSVERSSPIVIRADKELRLQAFVDVLDAVRQMKFSQVSLQTKTQ